MRVLVFTLVLSGLVAMPGVALHPGTTVIVPAAARGAGAGGSLWATALYVLNPGADAVDVTFAWLVRDQANPAPQTATRTVGAGSTLVLEDAVLDLFGVEAGGGAVLVAAPAPVVVNAGIFNRAGGQEFGQGFEGIPVAHAIGAGQTTHAVGTANNSAYRTNFFAVDATGSGAGLVVDVLGVDGQSLGSRSYTLGGHQPLLKGVAEVVATPVDAGVIRFTVQSGKVLVGSSRVNQGTGDPLTLAAWWECGGAGLAPASLAGLSLDLQVTPNECDMAPFTEDAHAVVTSDTEATITVYGGDQVIPIASYTAAGNLGYVETSLPEWGITDTWLTMVWADAAHGRFTGAATDFDGSPIQFAGTFAVVDR